MSRGLITIITIVFLLLLAGVMIDQLSDRTTTSGQWLEVNEDIAEAIQDRSPAGGSESAPAQEAPKGPVSINQATAEELDLLPGIGPAKAQAIVDYRTKHGPFQSLEQLMEVKGIGPKIYEKLKSGIMLDDAP